LGNNNTYDRVRGDLSQKPEDVITNFVEYLEKESVIHDGHYQSGGGNNNNKKNITIFDWNIDYRQNDSVSLILQEETIKQYVNKVDILTFQELSTKKLHGYGLDFSNYTLYNHYHGTDKLITCIHNTIPSNLVAKGKFTDVDDRAFMIHYLSLPTQTILLINVHMGHQQHGYHDNLYSGYIEDLQKEVSKLVFDRIIVVGDYNGSPNQMQLVDKYKKEFVLQNTIDEIKRKRTTSCCNHFRINNGKDVGMIDNIMDSYYTEETKKYYDIQPIHAKKIILSNKNIGSDHSPVLAKLPLSSYIQQGGCSIYKKDTWVEIGNKMLEML